MGQRTHSRETPNQLLGQEKVGPPKEEGQDSCQSGFLALDDLRNSRASDTKASSKGIKAVATVRKTCRNLVAYFGRNLGYTDNASTTKPMSGSSQTLGWKKGGVGSSAETAI